MRRFGLIAVALVGALSLTACGDATVEDDASSPTSVAPLERAPKKSTTESTTPEEEPETVDRPRPAEPQPQDQAAREVDEVPEAAFPRTPEDVRYLGAISDAEIDVDGVEDQLIGTASTVCDGGDSDLNRSTLPAVAGQLIEQGRTDKPVEDVVEIIETAATDSYC
ncbi:hypothetical protein [Corynebacterium sp.]|uniref:hypothetical protein n=1 Tax=Corynebacterium sp. TaxID=1720 RepID=UPI0026E0FFB4|nr:hypothetical protein [Corynebacterium sp.]MDO5511256.1 hypothetical protein [Corynebacterium sp.]